MRLTEKTVQFIVGGGRITNVDRTNNEDVLLNTVNIDIEDIRLFGSMSFETLVYFRNSMMKEIDFLFLLSLSAT